MTSDTARMYIDGKWVHARGGATFDVVNPADSSVVATVSDAGPSEAQRAVEAAHGAFREWSARPARERAQVLLNIQSLMEERRDVLARLITTENGKPLEEARKEVQFALAYFGWFAEQARRVTGEWVPSPHAGKRTWVLRQPVGPVAAVTPWNFPATMVTRKIAPALAAGCSVVLKPSPATPLTALAIARIADGCRAPARHLQRGHRQPGPDAPGRAAQSPAHPADRLHRLHGDRPRDHGRRRLSDSSGSVSSWAATHRSSSSTTPTSWPPSPSSTSGSPASRASPPTGSTSIARSPTASCPPSSIPCGRYGSGRASSAACRPARSSVPRRGPASMRWWRMPCGAATGWRPVAIR